MAGSGGYSVTIRAVDRASKEIDAINRRIAAVQAPVQRIQRSVARFSDVSGLQALGRGFGALRYEAEGALRAVGGLTAPLLGLTGAASVAGVLRLASAWATAESQIGFSAARIGVGVQQLSSLQGAARLAGTSSEALTAGLQTLGDTMVDAVAGRAPEAAVAMNMLGISLRDRVTGGARKALDVLPEIADAIASYKNPTQQAILANKFFGASAEAMLPFLRRGAAGIRELEDIQRRYGNSTPESVKAADDLRVAQTKLQMAGQGLVNSIMTQAGPALTDLATWMADNVAANREWIAQGLGDKIREFSTFLRGVDWTQVRTEIGNVTSEVNSIVEAIGGWKVAAEGLAAYMAVGFLAKILAPIATIARVMAALGMISPAGLAVLAAAGIAVGIYALTKKQLVAQDGQGNVVGAFDEFGRPIVPMQLPGVPRVDPSVAAPNSLLQLPAPQRAGLADWGGRPPPSATTEEGRAIPAEGRALLDALSFGESRGRYDAHNGGPPVTDFSKHPGAGASGRYQFLQGTWREAAQALGLRDFSPQSQDRAAWWLAQRDYGRRTGRELRVDLQSPDPNVRAAVAAGLRATWPSLPGGSQQNTSPERWRANLETALAAERQRDVAAAPPQEQQRNPSGLAAPSALRRQFAADLAEALPATAAPAEREAHAPPAPGIPAGPRAEVNGGTGAAPTAPTPSAPPTHLGSADIRIKLEGFPDNTRTTATTDGNVFSPPRVEHAMPRNRGY